MRQNTKKTVCRNGHSLKKFGTYNRPDGSKACRECLRLADQRRREKNWKLKNNPALALATGELRVK